MPLAAPRTWFLCHGEQGVRDVRQKAVQVKHMCLHWGGLWLLVNLTRSSVQLGLADLTLRNNKAKTPQGTCGETKSVPILAMRGRHTQTGASEVDHIDAV